MAYRQGPSKPAPKPKFESNDDDWDTDLTYENTATEKSQRYGSASVPGSGRVDHVDFNSLQEKMKTVEKTVKEDFKSKNPTRGYGGKYGTEQVMDKAAQDFSYKADVQKHSSQTDGKKGFGGQYGVDDRAKDKSAENFDYKPTVEKHSSQTDYTAGFGNTKEEPKQTPPTSPAVAKPPPKPVTPVVSTPPKPTTPVVSTPPKSPTPVVSKPAPTVPKPAAKPPVTETSASTASSTTTKADVGGIRARFENMNKQKEAEAQQRVAEERKKRSTVDQSSEKQQQSISTKNTTPVEVKQQETLREPSPTPESSTNTVEEPFEVVQEPVEVVQEPTEVVQEPAEVVQEPTDENQQGTDRMIGSINVSDILRQRRGSSPTPDVADEEWDDNA